MRLDTAQFVWVVEFSSVEQWRGGRVAVRGIVDASASHTDPDPIWLLHNEGGSVCLRSLDRGIEGADGESRPEQ